MIEIDRVLRDVLHDAYPEARPGADVSRAAWKRGRRAHRRSVTAAVGAGALLVAGGTAAATTLTGAADSGAASRLSAAGSPTPPTASARPSIEVRIPTIVKPTGVPQGLTVAPKPGRPGHVCVPGVAVDIHKVRDRLASMCLDTVLPRFAARRQPDTAAVDGASFYLSDGPLGKVTKSSSGLSGQSSNGASLTLQIMPGLKSFILSGGSHSLVPNKAGKVGTTTYVGATRVLGVPAVEVTEPANGSNPVTVGIMANLDGMSLECYASAYDHAPPVTFAQLVAVIDHLRWDRLGA